MAIACPKCNTELPQPKEPKTTKVACPGCGTSITIQFAPPKKAGPPDLVGLAAGTVLGGFRVDGPLGAGGMASVYRATQISLNRPVALKVLPHAMAKDPHFVARFARESDILAALNHPNIITIYDKGSDKGYYYFAMELVDGATLRDLINKGDMKPVDAFHIVSEVCAALEYAHRKGVVHRDMKPSNVLIDREGRIKVADFGIAHLARSDEQPAPELTMTNVRMGTQHYMAPEQQFDARSVDARADIYALGVMFYEMLCGQLPMGSFDLPSHKVAGLDERIDEIIQKSLKTDPEQRYSSPAEIATILREISGSAVTATGAGARTGAGGAAAGTMGGRPVTADHAARTLVRGGTGAGPTSGAGLAKTPPPDAGTIPEGSTTNTFAPPQVSETDRCPRCQFVNKPGARVCLGCGASLTRKCPKCKKDVPIRSDACEACGLVIATYLEEALTDVRKSLDLVEDQVQAGDYGAAISKLNALLRTPGEEFAEVREKARRRLTEVKELAEGETSKEEAQVAKGQQYYDRREYELALQTWKGLASVPPSLVADAKKRLEQGRKLTAAGDAAAAAGKTGEAAARYQEAMQYAANSADLEDKISALRGDADKRRVESLLAEAQGQVAQKKYEEALATWRKALDLAPHREDIQKFIDQGRAALADAYLRTAKKLTTDGDLDQAREILERARRHAPEREDIMAAISTLNARAAKAQAVALARKADAAQAKGDRAMALSLLEQAAALDPQNATMQVSIQELRRGGAGSGGGGGGGGKGVLIGVVVLFLVGGAFAAAYFGKQYLDEKKKDALVAAAARAGQAAEAAKKLEEAGDFTAARAAWEQLGRDFPGTEEAKRAADAAARLVEYDAKAQKLLEEGVAAEGRKDYATAVERYSAVLKDYPHSGAAVKADERNKASGELRTEAEKRAAAAAEEERKRKEAELAASDEAKRKAAAEEERKRKEAAKAAEAEAKHKQFGAMRDELKGLLVAKRDLGRIFDLARDLEGDEIAVNFLNSYLEGWQEIGTLLGKIGAASGDVEARVAQWELLRNRLPAGWLLPDAAAEDYEKAARAAWDRGGAAADRARAVEDKERALARAEVALQLETPDHPRHHARRVKALVLDEVKKKRPEAASLLAPYLDADKCPEQWVNNVLAWGQIIYHWAQAPEATVTEAMRRLGEVVRGSGVDSAQKASAYKWRAYIAETRGDLVGAIADLEKSVAEPDNPERAICQEALAEFLWRRGSDAETRSKSLRYLEQAARGHSELFSRFVGFLTTCPLEPGLMDVARKYLPGLEGGTSAPERFWLCLTAARVGHKVNSEATDALREREQWLQEVRERAPSVCPGDDYKLGAAHMMLCLVHIKQNRIPEAKKDQAALQRLVDMHAGDTGEGAALWASLRQQAATNRDFLSDK